MLVPRRKHRVSHRLMKLVVLALGLAALNAQSAALAPSKEKCTETAAFDGKIVLVRAYSEKGRVRAEVLIVKRKDTPPIPSSDVTLQFVTKNNKKYLLTPVLQRQVLVEVGGMRAHGTASASSYVRGVTVEDLITADVKLPGAKFRLKLRYRPAPKADDN